MRWLMISKNGPPRGPAAITALQEIFNTTWTLKQCALLKVEYLEFGYALFEQLQERSGSTLMDRLNPLWGAAADYLMSILKVPTVPEFGPFHPDECAPDMLPFMGLIQETCVKFWMLEWAVSRAKIRPRKPGQHETLLTRILLMATNLEAGQIRFAAMDSAMEVVVDYLEDGRRGCESARCPLAKSGRGLRPDVMHHTAHVAAPHLPIPGKRQLGGAGKQGVAGVLRGRGGGRAEAGAWRGGGDSENSARGAEPEVQQGGCGEEFGGCGGSVGEGR
jgi:hypothetical protein